MAAKCNITFYALEQLKGLLWGFHCDEQRNNEAIIENYIEFLNCPTVNYPICYSDNCDNDPIILDCEDLSIADIVFDTSGESSEFLHFIVKDYNILNGNGPYTCEWSYNTDLYDLVELTSTPPDITDGELILQLKDGINPNVGSYIEVTVTDSAGCEATKTCVYAEQVLHCEDGYDICPNDIGLAVTIV